VADVVDTDSWEGRLTVDNIETVAARLRAVLTGQWFDLVIDSDAKFTSRGDRLKRRSFRDPDPVWVYEVEPGLSRLMIQCCNAWVGPLMVGAAMPRRQLPTVSIGSKFITLVYGATDMPRSPKMVATFTLRDPPTRPE
jgi:hypothetical protein